MRSLGCALLLFSASAALPQIAPPEARPLPLFEVHNTSRLAALARLGFLTQTSILVEADTLPYLQAPVSLSIGNTTVFAAAAAIVRGSQPYSTRQQGPLLIVFSTRNRSRILTLPLHAFDSSTGDLFFLTALLTFHIRLATGCNPRAFGIVGAPIDLGLPAIHASSITLEQVVAIAAEASQPSMWIVAPEPTHAGCIPDPGARWQVGVYGFGSLWSACDQPFRASVGPAFLPPIPSESWPESACHQPHLPNPLPSSPR